MGVENEDGLEEDDLVNEASRDKFALFWKAMELPVVEALPCFQE